MSAKRSNNLKNWAALRRKSRRIDSVRASEAREATDAEPIRAAIGVTGCRGGSIDNCHSVGWDALVDIVDSTGISVTRSSNTPHTDH